MNNHVKFHLPLIVVHPLADIDEAAMVATLVPEADLYQGDYPGLVQEAERRSAKNALNLEAAARESRRQVLLAELGYKGIGAKLYRRSWRKGPPTCQPATKGR